MIYSKIMTWFTILVVYFSLFLSLFGLEITKLFTTGTIYWEAYKLIPIFSLGITFSMLKDVSVTGLQITKRTKIIGIFLTGIAVFNLAINLLLVPVWGIYGAALSSLLSQFIFFCILYFYAQKYYPIPYRLDKVGMIIFFGVILFLLGSQVNNAILGVRVIVKALALIIFPVLLFAFKVVDRSETELVSSLVKSIKNVFVTNNREDLEEKIPRIDESEL
jgi:O-antigen/teichoic acid export membrane protein